MTFNIEQADQLLSTTRAVRQRLDLDREVSDQILFDCIELGEQAPSGGNITSRRWIVIKDLEIKAKLADLYRSAGGSDIIERANREQVSGSSNAGVSRSAAYLAQNMEKVPALVLLTILGKHDGSGRPGLFDSVIQAGWSFCLALRARGLGSAWTTMHLGKVNEIGALLGIPNEVTQVVLLPVAWTKGSEFRAAPRKPVPEITW
ncbi:MAG: nitroreductase family protein, partial [Chloroflexota bacterium]|nr:nitroreductase family protein [Chloroflexota bacterium]